MAKWDDRQYLYREISVEPYMLGVLRKNVPDPPDDTDEREELLEQTEQELELLRLLVQHLTPHQREVYRQIFIEGRTQTETAIRLGVNQATVWKSLYGNHIYYPGGGMTINGGIVRRLRKLLELHERGELPPLQHG